MKTITTILFLLITLCTANASTDITQQCHESKIILKGHYNDRTDNRAQTRSLPTPPIMVFLDDSDLCLEFSVAISDLNIILIKEDIEIENITTSVESDQCETIDLSIYNGGNYKIVVTTPKGTYLSGNFQYIR